MFAAVGAGGDEFEAGEAVDAAQAAGQLGRPQPGLAAVRAGRPFQRAAARFRPSSIGDMMAARSVGSRRGRTGRSPRLLGAAQAGDEEAGGAVAVGADLQGAGLGRRGQLRGEGAEVVELERRHLAAPGLVEEGGDAVLVLAAGDRAGRVDEGAARREDGGGAAQRQRLDLEQALDRARRFAQAGGPGARRGRRGPSRARRGGPGRSPAPSPARSRRSRRR